MDIGLPFFFFRETKERLMWVQRGRAGGHRGSGNCRQEVKYEIRLKVKKMLASVFNKILT